MKIQYTTFDIQKIGYLDSIYNTHKSLFYFRPKKYHKVLNLRAELEEKLDSWRQQVLKIQMESLERAEEQAKQMIKVKKAKIMEANKEKFEKHAKTLEKLNKTQCKQRLQRSQSLKIKLANHEEWVAQKQKQHLDTLKKAHKAAELRQTIG